MAGVCGLFLQQHIFTTGMFTKMHTMSKAGIGVGVFFFFFEEGRGALLLRVGYPRNNYSSYT